MHAQVYACLPSLVRHLWKVGVSRTSNEAGEAAVSDSSPLSRLASDRLLHRLPVRSRVFSIILHGLEKHIHVDFFKEFRLLDDPLLDHLLWGQST